MQTSRDSETQPEPDAAASTQRSLNSAMIIEDHPLFCDALMMTLRSSVGITTTATAQTLQNAMDQLAAGALVDVILLDLNLPDVDGLDGLVRLRNTTEAPILIVSSMADDRIISAAIHAGAAGFVPKHSQREVYQSAFAALREGRTFIPAGFQLAPHSDAATDATHDATTRLASLTNQQARILQLICAGKLNKQIAYDLSIAEATVKAHVTAIMRKLGVQSRTQAVLIAQETSFAKVLHDLG